MAKRMTKRHPAEAIYTILKHYAEDEDLQLRPIRKIEWHPNADRWDDALKTLSQSERDWLVYGGTYDRGEAELATLDPIEEVAYRRTQELCDGSDWIYELVRWLQAVTTEGSIMQYIVFDLYEDIDE